jgi:hypothetical protein
MGSLPGAPNHVCSCTSEIHFSKKGVGIKKTQGSGGNDGSSRSDVLEIFSKYGLSSLRNIEEIDNPPGQCAEPHAVADALSKIGEPRKSKILSITVSNAIKPGPLGIIKPRCKTCKQWINTNKVQKQLLTQKYY